MSQYLLLIYGDETAMFDADEAAQARMLEAYLKFGRDNEKVILGGNALLPTTTATTVRGADTGDFIVTDGAFAEVKEALGGYYLIEAADLDSALAVAKQIPAGSGGVEVRPVMTFD